MGECREAVIGFHFDRSCSGMERMRASLKKSSFVLTAAIRRQAWRVAFYVLTRMYLRRTVDGTRIFSNLSVRKPDQGGKKDGTCEISPGTDSLCSAD